MLAMLYFSIYLWEKIANGTVIVLLGDCVIISGCVSCILWISIFFCCWLVVVVSDQCVHSYGTRKVVNVAKGYGEGLLIIAFYWSFNVEREHEGLVLVLFKCHYVDFLDDGVRRWKLIKSLLNYLLPCLEVQESVLPLHICV